MPASGLKGAGYSQAVLPSWLTPPVAGIGVAVAAASGEVLTGVVPGILAAAFAVADYALWRRRGRPWHDRDVIVLLLPALACAVWIAVGGLVAGVDRSDEARLLLEVGPGVALTGLITTLISYHGRHQAAPGDRG
jgi:hypothetical protein